MQDHVHYWRLGQPIQDGAWGDCTCGDRRFFDGGIDESRLDNGINPPADPDWVARLTDALRLLGS